MSAIAMFMAAILRSAPPNTRTTHDLKQRSKLLPPAVSAFGNNFDDEQVWAGQASVPHSRDGLLASSPLFDRFAYGSPCLWAGK